MIHLNVYNKYYKILEEVKLNIFYKMSYYVLIYNVYLIIFNCNTYLSLILIVINF